jgi:RNA polymerase sigma factor (sigma-70 family)
MSSIMTGVRHDAGSLFVTTHWSVVLSASHSESPDAGAALERLCQTYWYPLYAYVRRRGCSTHDAQDLTQEFFAWLLRRNWLAQADQQRGRFRSFLLTTFSRFLINEWDKARAQKRGGGEILLPQFDSGEARFNLEPAGPLTPEQIFERRWALEVLATVMKRLGDEFEDEGKAELFATLKPCLLGERTAQPYAALAPKLGMTEGSVKVVVHRLRQRYRQLLRGEIANTVVESGEIEEEIRHLLAVLARG